MCVCVCVCVCVYVCRGDGTIPYFLYKPHIVLCIGAKYQDISAGAWWWCQRQCQQQHVRAAHAARSKLWHRLPRPRLGHSARPPRTIVAQSSALMKDSSPLYTAKQFLARWRGAQMSIAQVGLESCQALGRV